jgi:predicted house-cleaning noncanonical NTP pyrophosphatase (MazG superfamily)
MDINNKVKLLEEMQEFLDSRKDSYNTISELLNQIAAVQTDSEKLLILKSSGIQKQLQKRINTLNNLCVSKLNNDITENLQDDNQRLSDFREKLHDLLKN